MINTILSAIGFIITGIIVSVIFVNVRKFILKRTANIIKTDLFEVPKEKVSGSKFATGMLSFLNPVL